MLKGSKVVVVGGAGFIGQHLINRLIKEDCKKIVILDTVAYPSKGSISNTGIVDYHWCDIVYHHPFENFYKGADYVFHLATLPMEKCNADPMAMLDTNIRGTLNVILAAEKAKVKKVVFSSASSVYGEYLEDVTEENVLNKTGPGDWYGTSKVCAEHLFRASKLKYVLLRYMNVYGPNHRRGLILLVLEKIKRGERPIINGDGSQSFDHVYVDDVVEANILAATSNVSGRAFNIGGNNEASVNTIVDILLRLTGSNLEPEYRGEPFQKRRVGRSSLAEVLLGYEPKVKLTEGLRRIVESEYSKDPK